MGQILGFLIGGFIWSYIFGWLAGRFAFRETEPDKKAFIVGSIAIAIIFLVATFGFGSIYAGLFYVPGALVGIYLLRRDYLKAWIVEDDTFD